MYMLRNSFAGLVLIMSAFATPSWALTSDGRYVLLGDASCGEWMKLRRSSIQRDEVKRWQLHNWVIGYITAYNRWVPGPKNIVGTTYVGGIYLWIDNYCGSHPLDDLSHALEALVRSRQ